MELILTSVFLFLYSIDILLLFVFGIHAYVMVYLYRKNKKNCLSKEESKRAITDPTLPIVTVQLPVFNEFYVVDRLIQATTKLNYPKDKLEIQVLDDSTDESVEIATKWVNHFKAQGFWIDHIHRTDRKGHKAGALKNGMELAKGEFIAIFDADFLPSPNFLLDTMGYFDRPEIGMVQARWGHINAEYNILTKAQSFGIDGHFMIEQVARNGSDLWMNFNGTAGVWRKSCILDAGGWSHDTLTEDFDLSYRAELKDWKFQYLQDVVCPAEVPATMNAYKSQQFRWCKGSIQTALKLIPSIFQANLSKKIKLEALIHLISYSVHPLMVVNILFTGPLLLLDYWSTFQIQDLAIEFLMGSAFFLTIGSFGPVFFYAYSQRELHKDWLRRLIYLPVLVMVGTGIAIVNTRAWLEAILGIPSGFKRTPKLKIENKDDSLQDRLKYSIPLDIHVLFEFLMGVYCLFCIYLSVITQKPFVIGFMVLYSFGFFFVAFQSIRESLWKYFQWKSPAQEPVAIEN